MLSEDELYPNAAILRAFANSPVANPDAKMKKLQQHRDEVVAQLNAIQTAADRERKRVEALEKAMEARKRKTVKKDVQ